MPRARGYPLVGILPHMCNQGLYRATMTALFDLAEDCGLSRASVGPIPIVYVRDPAILRHLLARNADGITRFGPDARGPFNINQRLIGSTAATADGHDWHRWRSGLLRHFHRPAALRRAHPGLVRIVRRHVAALVGAGAGPDLRKAMEAYAVDSV